MSAFDDWSSGGSGAADDSTSDGPAQNFADWTGASTPAAASAPAAPVTAVSAAPSAPASSGVKAAPPLPSIGQGAGDVASGIAQTGTHALSWLADKVAPNSQFAKDARTGAAQVDAQIIANDAAYAAKRQQDGGSGLDLGRMVGSAAAQAPLFMTGGADTLLGKLALSAGQSAGTAAITPVTPENGQSYASAKANQIGANAAIGLAVPAAVAGAGGLKNVLSPVLNPAGYVGRALAGTMDPATAAAVAGNIRNAPSFVPNSLPTLDQVGGNVGLVQTAKALNNSAATKGLFVNRGIGNNAARWDVINGVAGTPADMTAAIGTREAAAAPAINSILTNGNPVSATPVLTAIDNTLNSSVGTNPTVRSALNDIRSQITSRASGTANWVSPDILDGLRQNAGKFLSQHAPNGAVGTREAAGVAPIQTSITNAVDAANPGYKAYLDAYRQNSIPINTMQVGQDISTALAHKAQDVTGAATIMPPAFNGALKSALGNAEHGIDPAAQAALEGVQNDLGRATISNSIRQGGSDTAYNNTAQGWLARGLYGPTFGGASKLAKGGAAAATALAGHPWIAGATYAGLNKIGQVVGSGLDRQLGGYFMNPETFLPYLDKQAATAAPGAISGLLSKVAPAARPAVLDGLLSLYNQK